ncbi:hypothetical protein BX600DRAFT_539104 [Xylariales sp. PMI_506]|nr:hypothetical protein BX600DRAFT_539104 [Xylariales sp. PMI_506]
MNSLKLLWIVSGANSGIGLCITRYVLSQGHTVIALARDLSKFPESIKDSPGVELLALDVAGPGLEIEKTVNGLIAKYGRVDVLVNNAGFGLHGPLEGLQESDIRYQFDVNFFGLVNLTKAVIPQMRKQGSGVIIQMSSVGGFCAIEGSPVYLASKFAVEGITEGLALEIKRFGIRVHLVEPGFFRTNFLGPVANGTNVAAQLDGYPNVEAFLTSIHGNQPGNPEKAAERVFEIVTGSGMAKGLESELRFLFGSDCLGMLRTKIEQLSQTADKMKDIAPSTDYVIEHDE